MRFTLLLLWLCLGSATLHLRSGDIETTQVPTLSRAHSLQSRDLTTETLYIVEVQRGEDKAEIVDIVGHPLTDYLPDNGYVVFTTHAKALQVERLSGVSWVGLMKPEYKSISSLGSRNGGNDRRGTGSLIVSLFNHITPQQAKQAREEIANSGIEGVSATLVSDTRLNVRGNSNELITLIRRMDVVTWVEAETKKRPLGPGGARAGGGGKPAFGPRDPADLNKANKLKKQTPQDKRVPDSGPMEGRFDPRRRKGPKAPTKGPGPDGGDRPFPEEVTRRARAGQGDPRRNKRKQTGKQGGKPRPLFGSNVLKTQL